METQNLKRIDLRFDEWLGAVSIQRGNGGKKGLEGRGLRQSRGIYAKFVLPEIDPRKYERVAL